MKLTEVLPLFSRPSNMPPSPSLSQRIGRGSIDFIRKNLLVHGTGSKHSSKLGMMSNGQSQVSRHGLITRAVLVAVLSMKYS